MTSRGLARYYHQKARTPVWANNQKIRDIYRESLRRGPNYEVDHIVPLNHPLVCGLHCEQNLRVIHYLANRKKGNYQWPDMPMEQQELLEIPRYLWSGYQLSLDL